MAFVGGQDGLWFVWDPCGVICAFITYGLIVFADFVLLVTVVLPEPNALIVLIYLIFNGLSLLAAASHLKAMVTEPGVIPRETISEDVVKVRQAQGDAVRHCRKCRSIKPQRAHHCSICRRCVRKMDHHCPWVNNCVGENNQKYFVLFTMYICAISLIALVLTVRTIINCLAQRFEGCGVMSHTTTFVFLIIVTFEAVIFFLFTFIMCLTQVCSIVSDETYIEQLKKDDRDKNQNFIENFESVFGGRMSLQWLSPFSPSVSSLRKREPRLMHDV
ncbi:palmitoyltransferase ZDHHC3-A-like [Corticium candelabrum]|uniref:palmitoyltransferase ZDHHC3-A-like n=1 Tax=Corticium candelabrum TaxID=121492 RepID=UPI002E25A224|nr:palmitoyltransferase ZDHHC3-A-like [Corticium candelabrum]